MLKVVDARQTEEEEEDIMPLQERDLETVSALLSLPPIAQSPRGVKHSAGNDHASDSTFRSWCLAAADV